MEHNTMQRQVILDKWMGLRAQTQSARLPKLQNLTLQNILVLQFLLKMFATYLLHSIDFFGFLIFWDSDSIEDVCYLHFAFN